MSGASTRRTERTYAPGRLMTIHGEPGDAPAVLWHGSGPSERTVLAGLADALVDTGLQIFVPDWDSTATDGGRADLLASLTAASEAVASRRAGPTEGLLLIGWSLGGTAAAAAAFGRPGSGLQIRAVVGLGADPDARDGVSGLPLPQLVGAGPPTCPLRFVHGTQDTIVPVVGVRALVDTIRANGGDASLTEVGTDHAGVVGTRYDPSVRRCVPADTPAARTGLHACVEAMRALSAG